MGGGPVAEHGTLLPGAISTAPKSIFGGTSKAIFLIQLALKVA